MADYNGMTCEQLAAALASETDPAKKDQIQAAMDAKGCNAQTDGDEDSGGGNGGNSGGH